MEAILCLTKANMIPVQMVVHMGTTKKVDGISTHPTGHNAQVMVGIFQAGINGKKRWMFLVTTTNNNSPIRAPIKIGAFL